MQWSILFATIAFAFVARNVDASCSSNYGGCDKRKGLCWEQSDSGGKSYCTCKAGYKRDKGKKGKCIDVNECSSGLHDCDTTNGKCVNTIGGYTCKCNCGFVLDYTRTKCINPRKISGTCNKQKAARCRRPTRRRTRVRKSRTRRRPIRRRSRRSRSRRRYDVSEFSNEEERDYVSDYSNTNSFQEEDELNEDELNEDEVNENEFNEDQEESVASEMLDLLTRIKENSQNDEDNDEFEDNDDDALMDNGNEEFDSFRMSENPRLKFDELLYPEEKKGSKTCLCEIGYQRNKCGLCEDVDECKTGKHSCVGGTCRNSDGGYYCICKPGKVLGPCGFKCYDVKDRPSSCTSKTVTAKHLMDQKWAKSEGITEDQLITALTERAYYAAGTRIPPIKLLYYGTCSTSGQKKTQSFDLNRDSKTDIQVQFYCTNGNWKIQSVNDLEAVWGPWTCWTECKATCWGGIQTRTRTCVDGLAGYGKCKGAATEKKNCYSGPKCKLLVRRNAQTLTTAQKKDYIQAMKKYRSDLYSAYGFHSAAGTHEWPYQCRSSTGINGACCYHGAKLNFLSWHRVEIKNFEMGLTRYLKDKTLGMPYWNWLEYSSPPPLLWSKTLYGATNPFAEPMEVRLDESNIRKTERIAQPVPAHVEVARGIYQNETVNLQSADMIHEFSESLESSHNLIHMAVCPMTPNSKACEVSMGSLTYAAFDPTFMFHHTNVDRLFSQFRQQMFANKEFIWTRQAVLEPQESIYHFNEPFAPFNNASLTPWKQIRAVNSMQNVIFNEELMGYTYDTLTPGGKVTGKSEIEEKATRHGNDKLSIALYQRNIQANILVRFFFAGKMDGTVELPPCDALSDSNKRFMGSQLILGSANEHIWKNKQPTLTDVTDFMSKNRIAIGTSATVPIKTCLTNDPECTKNCPVATSPLAKLLPAPSYAFHPRRTSVEQLHFRWDTKYALPIWGINVRAGTQWVRFWGEEQGNIMQVHSNSKYLSCNKSGGVAVDCSMMCVLPKGNHYFIHSDTKKCREGLKMKILAVF